MKAKRHRDGAFLHDVSISGACLSLRYLLLVENAAEPQIISCDRER